MASFSLSLLLLAAGYSQASPMPPQSSIAAAPSPQVKTDHQFTLVAKVITSTLNTDIHNWVVGVARVGPGGYALIMNKVDSPLDPGAGRLYQQGNTTDTGCSVGQNIVRGASSVPLAFTISDTTGSDYGTCSLVTGGDPTAGVGVTRDETGIPYLVGNGDRDGQYYVCNVQVETDVLPSLNWRPAEIPAPVGCADIKLVPQCAGQLPQDVFSTQDLVPNLCLSDAATYDAPPAVGNANGDGQLVAPLE